MTIQNLETLEGINGINLRDVKSSAVLLDDIHQKHYTFIDGIRVDGSLVVTGKINGVEFNDRLVRVSAKKSEKGLVKGKKSNAQM